MRYAMRVLALLALATLVATATMGCRSLLDRAAEEAVEGVTGIEVDEDDGSVTITTEDEDGKITITSGEGAEIPDSFPNDFPLYDGVIVGSSSITVEDGAMVTVTMETDDDSASVANFFEDEFEDLGWSVDFTSSTSEGGMSVTNYLVTKGERNGTVAISSENGVTTISVTVLSSDE